MPAFAIPLGVISTLGAWIALDYASGQACPVQAFIVGSIPGARFLAILPCFFVGMAAGLGLGRFVQNSLPWAAEMNSKSKPRHRKQTRRAILMLIGSPLIFGSLMFVSAAEVGFCAMPDGITYKRFPWSKMASYQWAEVRRITVICERRVRGFARGFILSMADGTEIDLYDTARVKPLAREAGEGGAYRSRQRAMGG